MKIGLFFGSFNPIHKGHVAIARYMAAFAELDAIWLVVSPHNPLKDKSSLVDANKRLKNVKRVFSKDKKIIVSRVEFTLPQPSYTVNTLAFLRKKFPKHRFFLIIGSDNLKTFRKWKDYRKILSKHIIYVYPRSGSLGGSLRKHPHVRLIKAPRMDVSSTQIRQMLKKGKDVKKLLP